MHVQVCGGQLVAHLMTHQGICACYACAPALAQAHRCSDRRRLAQHHFTQSLKVKFNSSSNDNQCLQQGGMHDVNECRTNMQPHVGREPPNGTGPHAVTAMMTGSSGKTLIVTAVASKGELDVCGCGACHKVYLM